MQKKNVYLQTAKKNFDVDFKYKRIVKSFLNTSVGIL